MKIDLTKDELDTLTNSLIGSIKSIEANKRRAEQSYGEDFDEMYEPLIQKCRELQRKLLRATLTIQED